MIVTPNTNIRLLRCPLQLDNKNQVDFYSWQEQETFFFSLPYKDVDASMYQRNSASIFYPDIYDNLITYNYVMYQNTNYSNKWFYAFVIDMKYVNDNVTQIFIAEDVYMTWHFQVEWLPSYIERDMLPVADDVPRCKFSA